MLTLITGPAGSGKTRRVLDEIRDRAALQKEKLTMIVPEQFSHGAERALCEACGDGIGLWAEVVSFSRLCSRVLAETGGLSGTALDKGGRVLVMQRALSAVSPALRVFGSTAASAGFLSGLLDAYEEMRSSRVGEQALMDAAETLEGSLSGKLSDFAAVFGAYRAMMPEGCYDPADRLEALGEQIGHSSFGTQGPVYVDGFGDFTAQERVILEKLLKKGCDVTVCLTCGALHGMEPEFALPRSTALRLLRYCTEEHIPVRELALELSREKQQSPLGVYCASLFLPEEGQMEANGAVRVFHASGRSEECELAAAKVLVLVRAGARWRDIAVVARGWESYAQEAAGIFEKYGIPVHITEKRPVLERPVLAFLTGILDVIRGGWDSGDVFACLKTGVLELTPREIDRMENYVHRWNIRGRSMWCRPEGWTANPNGYRAEPDAEALQALNTARLRFAGPVGALETALSHAQTGADQARAMWQCAKELDVPGALSRRAAALQQQGKGQLSQEYLQLWDIFVTALEQFAAVLGEVSLKTEEFQSLLKLVLSQYDVGTIPAALDRVAMGELTRTKSRGLSHLLVLGCTDDSIPALGSKPGLLTDEERDAMLEAGLELCDTGESRLSREMNAVYTAFSLPEKSLYLFAPVLGGTARPSIVLQRAADLFGLKPETITDDARRFAPIPCFKRVSGAASPWAGAAARDAEAYFAADPQWGPKLSALRLAAMQRRSSLSREYAEKLYSQKLNLTASRVDKFYACRFSYFLQYGLKLKPRKKEDLDAPSSGTFLHYLLEHVCADVKQAGGFGAVTDDQLRAMTASYVSRYAEEALSGLADTTARYRYLFHRLGREAQQVVLDMAQELRHSEFAPIDFELNFAPGKDMEPVEVTDGETALRLIGCVDRVDGWVHNGKLYLRVVDYKTGKKSFSLSDVWYGMGLQMLIYLFALAKQGEERYGLEIVPAGVLYAPARDVVLRVEPGTDPATVEAERLKKLQRSGLLLNDPVVLAAMDRGLGSGLLPVKLSKTGELAGDALARSEQLGQLAAHIDSLLLTMAKELRRGSAEAEPFWRGEQENACMFCDFREVCRFREENGDIPRRLQHKKAAEVWQDLEGEA